MSIQEYQRMQAYARIASQVDFIEGVTPEGVVLVRLGLICTVYFRHGGQRDVGYKVLGCVDRFVEQFGEHLQGQFHSLSGRSFTSLRKGSLMKAKEKLQARVDDGGSFSWDLQSEKNGEAAAAYSITAFTSHADSDPYGVLSYVKIILPWQLLETPEGEQQFKDWVRYLCEALDVEHGYAGLSFNLPYDYHQFQPYEFQMAQRYSGLMVDSAPHLDLTELRNGIKGVNWLTLLGPRYIEQLGGMAALKQQLQLPDVGVQETDNGRLIIQAGALPDVGAPENGHPPAYVAVNRVLKSVRVQNPDQLHTCMDDAEGFTKTNTLAWYARFDDAPLTDAPTENAEPAGMRCEAGKPCPEDGIWWTPAKADSRRVFDKGETMPDFPGSAYGGTIWYLERE
ncbi:DUF3396 domain-containing protein [Chromobacterium paludis]|uniref:DUF3396 domain-containing protein n=1 Tax=Chromobacterium paludis TaxID=2605945 RepID=A0A5C1DH40_9NEIS|nr:DUF3396 domain-containing protein [Chromobacterium paludis]QEL56036.1 DUF3396 domain-containing protein [Chromobacterium paludis]